MQIPHTFLTPAALQAVIEEFVTRDGTDHTIVAERIKDVAAQLKSGELELHYDPATTSCNIIPVQR
jgi:uncharacterized protein YheU (UPF0270 family)